jgi:hypothetical protein
MAEEVVSSLGTFLTNTYNSVIGALPPYLASFVSLLILVLLVVLYAVFIWKFYRFVAKKNVIELNLSQYNTSANPFFTKLVAGIFYLIEYIIVMPFLIFFWFGIFTLFLIVLTENQTVSNLLLISTIIIAAIRMTAYYKEDLSKDISKLLPFTLLAISLLNPGFFSVERIINQLAQLPGFFGQILSYLGFIIILEIILRLFDFLFSLLGLHDEVLEDDEAEK